MRPRSRRRSPAAGVARPVTISFAFVIATPPVHGSHASPTPSPSASSWPGFGSAGQLSVASQTPSPSASGHGGWVVLVVVVVVVVGGGAAGGVVVGLGGVGVTGVALGSGW